MWWSMNTIEEEWLNRFHEVDFLKNNLQAWIKKDSRFNDVEEVFEHMKELPHNEDIQLCLTN